MLWLSRCGKFFWLPRNRARQLCVRNNGVVPMRQILSIFVLATGLPITSTWADDDSRTRVRLGGVVAGFNYSNGPFYGPWGYGPGFYRPYWGMYDPFWTSSYLHPGLYRGFAYAGPEMGQIKLDAPKEASVYLDGAFAGTVQKLKSIWLEPGIYELQVSNPTGGEFKKKVYVLSGKTLNIRAELKR